MLYTLYYIQDTIPTLINENLEKFPLNLLIFMYGMGNDCA